MRKYSILFIVLLFILIGCSNNEEVAQEQTLEPNMASDIFTSIEVSTMIADGINEEAPGFTQLAGVTQDKEGNLYISDYENHVIHRISTNGEAEVIGSYASDTDESDELIGGFQDGSVEEAQFNFPIGLAMDSENNIYIADSGNGAIRKLSETGEVETVVEGLLHPFDIAINKDDGIFLSDALSHQIYRLMADGTLEVFAGGGYVEEDGDPVGAYKDGQGENAQFNEPSGLAFTPSGDLLVADAGNQRIRLIHPDGEVSTVAGSGDAFIPGTTYVTGGYEDGVANEAQFNFPKSVIAVQDNQFIVADTYNHVLRLIHDGEVSTLAGTGYAGFDDGNQSTAEFYNPYAISSIEDRLILVDQYNHAVREVRFTKE